MHKNLRRGVVALATALASLVIVAHPASASVFTGAVTAGTLTLISSTGTSTDSVPFGGTGTGGAGCANSVSVSGTPTGAVATWSITALTIVGRAQLSGSGTWYVVSYAWDADTAGNVGVTGGTPPLSQLLTVVMDFHTDFYIATDQTSGSTSCTHGTSRLCRFLNADVTISGLYTGDINSPSVGDTITLSSSAGTLGSTTPPCNTPFAGYNNGTLSITGLTLPVTTIT